MKKKGRRGKDMIFATQLHGKPVSTREKKAYFGRKPPEFGGREYKQAGHQWERNGKERNEDLA